VLAAEQHCYLVREYKYGIERGSLKAAGGATETHEQPLDAAKREVKEELGVEATDWIALGAIDHFATAVRSPTSLFLARSVKEGKQALDAGERVQVVKLHFARALEMVMSGEITHGPSCVLILKADRYLRQLKEEGSRGTEK
jgi:8-oxo-dGTP pyrophosphatase MutT (NUDIX family)